MGSILLRYSSRKYLLARHQTGPLHKTDLQLKQIKTEFFSSKKQCNFLLQIQWNINPEIFRIGGFALRYYSIMFALTFYSSYLVLSKTYIKENVSISLLNKLTIFVFIGTLAGARWGHTLFYEFDYKHHLLKVILPFRVDLNGKFELTG